MHLRALILILFVPLLAGRASAADTPPPPIQIILVNAEEVARAREGAFTVGIAGLFLDIEQKVREEVAAQMIPALQARGIQSVIGPGSLVVSPEQARGFYVLDPTTQALAPASVAAGTFLTLQVTVLNPEEVVKREKGGATLIVGKVLGLDLAQKVGRSVGTAILQELAAEDVQAMVVF